MLSQLRFRTTCCSAGSVMNEFTGGVNKARPTPGPLSVDGLTANVDLREWDKLPDVPTIVRMYVPAGVVPSDVSVMVEPTAPLTWLGTKLALTPVGKPSTLRLTPSLNMPEGVAFTV